MVLRLIVWFRSDLRVADNPVLDAAASFHGPKEVVPVYCFDPRSYGVTRWGSPKTRQNCLSHPPHVSPHMLLCRSISWVRASCCVASHIPTLHSEHTAKHMCTSPSTCVFGFL